METNKLSQKLLAEGWTKDQTPPGLKPWRDFDGGWTYDYRSRSNVVFEAPCGLLWKRREISYCGHMSFMGVEWTEENDNITTVCPHYDMAGPCLLNHPLLRDKPIAGCHYEQLCFCALHETDRPWNYEQSAQKVKDDQKAVEDRLWEEFQTAKKGRVCRYQSKFNRHTREWSSYYDPMFCHYGCRHCSVLGKELSEVRGNVFYDVKITWTQKGIGFLPDTQKTDITKGVKFLDKPCSLTIAEAIAKVCKRDIQRREETKRSIDLYLGRIDSIEVLNIRAERKESRDLLQDLKDIEEGATIHHASDDAKAAKAKKSENRKKSAQAKIARLEKAVLEDGFQDQPDHMKRRMMKFLGEDRISELEEQREEEQSSITEQLSLF